MCCCLDKVFIYINHVQCLKIQCFVSKKKWRLPSAIWPPANFGILLITAQPGHQMVSVTFAMWKFIMQYSMKCKSVFPSMAMPLIATPLILSAIAYSLVFSIVATRSDHQRHGHESSRHNTRQSTGHGGTKIVIRKYYNIHTYVCRCLSWLMCTIAARP